MVSLEEVITQRFEFVQVREEEIAPEIRIRSNAGGRDRAGDSTSFECGREIAREIQIRSNAKGGDYAGDSNSLERERGRSCAMI